MPETSFSAAPIVRPLPERPLKGDSRGRLRFLSFDLRPTERLLLRNGEPVDIGSRAFDLLMALVCARGQIVSKAAIFDHVWPSITVEEGNLRLQMSALRRVLGDERDIIKTIRGRGYLFAAEVSGELSSAGRPAATIFRETANAMSDGLGQQADTTRTSTSVTRQKRAEPPVIAVVEDDENTREALEGLLRSWGYVVETYPETKAMMEAGRADQVECLVLDVWLPGQSGLDFQAALKEHGFNVPIVFISGHADVHMSVRAMKAGAVEFLTKPVRHQDLLEAIRSAVDAGRVDN
jgi:DNA-binding response OmpR family regulator